jgi:hypothetical protein
MINNVIMDQKLPNQSTKTMSNLVSFTISKNHLCILLIIIRESIPQGSHKRRFIPKEIYLLIYPTNALRAQGEIEIIK